MSAAHQPVVAVINTSQESIDTLQGALSAAQFSVVTALALEFKTGQRDFEAFVKEHQPSAIVYDIALPYVSNWKFFQEHILGSQVLPEQCFVLTTANKSVLDLLVGPTPTFELIGRPLDLQSIVDAVRQAVAYANQR